MKEIVLIGDPRVRTIGVKECGEPLVDLQTDFPHLKFDETRNHVQKSSQSISFARKTIGEKLTLAQTLLPSGVQLLIKECYRPMWVQKGFWDRYSAFLRSKFPAWSEAQIADECSKLNAPVEVAPHTTGDAVDLTLVNTQGEWLDMGTTFNASPLETQGATYSDAENISELAKTHRQILSAAMTGAGFVNYPTEWWHWSYGDKYWALLRGERAAIYGSVELEPNSENREKPR